MRQAAGWRVEYVSPYEVLLWVREVWIRTVCDLLAWVQSEQVLLPSAYRAIRKPSGTVKNIRFFANFVMHLKSIAL
jgi:hypothetical protein